jgi:hypothetical protein
MNYLKTKLFITLMLIATVIVAIALVVFFSTAGHDAWQAMFNSDFQNNI